MMLYSQMTGIEEIGKFEDIIKLMDFVYKTIPWGKVPDNSWMTAPWNYQKQKIVDLYTKFVKKELVGWCGANSQYLSLLLALYGVKSMGYNYGIAPLSFTHVGVVVYLDGMSFFLDPYFNRYYTYQDGFPLQFDDLLNLISDRKFSVIKSVYGPSKKLVITEQDGEQLWSPKEMETSVMNSFLERGLKEKMEEFFGLYEPLLLLRIRVL